jgi:imidazolonepropionase-like amidohydrolase
MEDKIGSLEVGKYADLVVLYKDAYTDGSKDVKYSCEYPFGIGLDRR